MKKININDAELIQTLASKRVKDGQANGTLNRCDERSYVGVLETFARAQVGHELEVTFKMLEILKKHYGVEVIILENQK